MSKNKKPPIRKIFCDDFAIEVEGETYYPHLDEYVSFKSKGTVGNVFNSLRLAKLANLSEEEIAQVMSEEGTLGQVLEGLASNIVDWNWTNQSGDAYTSPPDKETLKELEFVEIAYLMGLQSGQAKKSSDEDERKND